MLPPNTHDSNGLKAKAIEYFKYLNGLKIMAGMNFIAAMHDLDERDILSDDLGNRLQIALYQEVIHAAQVRKMLRALGYENKAELGEIREWLRQASDRALSAFPPEQVPYVGMLLNHVIEDKLAKVGNLETLNAMLVVADTVPEVWSPAVEFYETVKREEPQHVALDEEVIALYQPIYPDLNVSEAMRVIRARGTPFYRAIRAKREFVRAASRASDAVPASQWSSACAFAPAA